MKKADNLTLEVSPKKVELDYPGAKGVTFEDARLVIRNDGDREVAAPSLELKFEQEGKELWSGVASYDELGLADSIGPKAEVSTSLFRLLQKEVKGFASRVNMFGYKASLDWTFRVTASVVETESGPSTSRGPCGAWEILWQSDEGDPARIVLRVTAER